MSALFAARLALHVRILDEMRWALVTLALSGCYLAAGPDAKRGEACDHDADCEDGLCKGGICNGGDCRPVDPDCGAGFHCEYYEGGIFSDGHYSCEMLCGADSSCPDWYTCSGGYCDYESLMIEYTPAAPVANEPVTFTGRFYEDKPRRAASWLFETSNGIPSREGETATLSFAYPGTVNAVFTAAYEGDGNAYQVQLKLMIQ